MTAKGTCAHINANTIVQHAKRLTCYTCEGENVPEPFRGAWRGSGPSSLSGLSGSFGLFRSGDKIDQTDPYTR